MQIHCLGTTGYHPSPSRHTACYYLSDLALLLDAGTALFRLIECLRNEPKDSLDILLTHAHLDHIAGLTFLVDAIAVTSLEQVRIHGEAEKLDAVKEHLFNELLFPVPPAFEFIPLGSSEGEKTIGGTPVRWFQLERHPGGSVGYILQCDEKGLGEKRLGYVTDTISDPNAEYVSKIRDLDLLLHECYFRDDQKELAEMTGHSWLSAVIEIVQKVKPRQCGLIHINPLSEILGQEFSLTQNQAEELQMWIAEDCQVVDF